MNHDRSSTDRTAAALPAPPLPDVTAIALFLDIDGTLIDFAPYPDMVRIPAEVPSLLHRLHRRLDGALALISGRPLDDIDHLLDTLPPIASAGLHGAEVRRADGTVIGAVEDSARMEALRLRAKAMLSTWPGVRVEAKPDALALHYRMAPAQAVAVRNAARQLAREAGPRYALQPGDHVIELKPAGADKGLAVRRLMRDPPFAGRVPWVLGDDLTDEHAFAAAGACGGIGIIVGARRPTRARHALPDPTAARTWLQRVASAPARGERHT